MSSDDSMREADVANGEDPDETNRQPEDGPGNPEPGREHRTTSPETESDPGNETREHETPP